MVGLFDSDDVHQTSGEGSVSADLTVNQDVVFLIVEDQSDIATVQGVVESFLEEDGKGETFAELVGTLGGTSSLLFFAN